MKKLLAYLGVPIIRIFDKSAITIRRARLESVLLMVVK